MGGNSDITKFIQMFPEPSLAKDLMDILEDYRIEARIRKEYPGLEKYAREINLHLLEKRRPCLDELKNEKQRAVEAIAQRLLIGMTKGTVSKELEEIISYAVSATRELRSANADVHESARKVADVYFFLHEKFKDSEEFKKPYEQIKPFSTPLNQELVNKNIGDFGKTAKKFIDEMRKRAGSGFDSLLEFLRKMTGDNDKDVGRVERRSDYSSFGNEVKKEEGINKDNEEDIGRKSYDLEEDVSGILKGLFRKSCIKPKDIEAKIDIFDFGDFDNLEDFFKEVSNFRDEKALEKKKGDFLYKEWGNDIGNYRPNWARVREIRMKEGSIEDYNAVLQRHSGLVGRVQREFQMLREEGLRRIRKQDNGEEIDFDAVIEFFVDRKMGQISSEKIYEKRMKQRRDIAVAFLIDMSGSTGGNVNDKMRVIDCEREALIIMAEAINQLNDSFAIYGFSGAGRENVEFYIFKDFSEQYDINVKKRILRINNMAENRDGAALRHTITKLKAREEKSKLIIFLSDGQPADRVYSSSYSIQDTKMALREAQQAGIKSFCITVDKGARDYLPQMYCYSNWVRINDIAQLPEKITNIYRRLTR